MLLVTIRYLWLLNEEFCPAPGHIGVAFVTGRIRAGMKRHLMTSSQRL